jgi:hypothetical protein
MTDHLPVGTSYGVVRFADGTFGVEVTTQSCRPYMVNTFLTEADASGWVAEQQRKTRERG